MKAFTPLFKRTNGRIAISTKNSGKVIENANGLIRQYLPKKTDLRNLDNTYLQTIVQALNNRPRKILNHRTPAERFQKLSGVALRP